MSKILFVIETKVLSAQNRLYGQGGLACCDSWGRKESDTTEQLN